MTDLLLGLGMSDILVAYAKYVKEKYKQSLVLLL